VRCGANLFGSPGPALPATALGPVQVPLTSGQKLRLLLGVLPLAFFLLVAAGYFVLSRLFNLPPAPPPIYLFIGVIVLLTGFSAVQRVRDMVSGVAVAQEDLLRRSFNARGSGGARYYGRFERLGTLRLSQRDYVQRGAGQRYRVLYSPASKVVWSLDPPDGRLWEQ